MAHSGTNRDHRAAPFRGSVTATRASGGAGVARVDARVWRGARRLRLVIDRLRLAGLGLAAGAPAGRARGHPDAARVARNRRGRSRASIFFDLPIVSVGEVVRDRVQARREHAGTQETEGTRGSPGA